ncbi:hypothetical protein ARMSODRAFT_1055857 [Armillaria solidipes]|uniref:Thioester reductase (TE) domain-containing protein n=1 Tax=Armillaria solidipes TaxID=1076256 RepID=A0A2H3CDZ4_9AGAR|nr:hypothetical protein ARMSODRAFT_1055857 [Armillaria solidipes]
MATQTDIPPDLTVDEKALLFQFLDAELNSGILYALLYGIYTGILAVALWNIFINKCWPIRRAVVIVIILLHALITISLAASWSWTHFAFIENGQNFWTVSLILIKVTQASYWEIGITASISTILADLYMLTVVSILDLVLLDGLGAALACCSASNIVPRFRDRIKNCVGIVKGIAPTLLVGRAAAGHTRPRDDSDESTVSSLHFQTPSELGTTSSQLEESSVQSSVLGMDIEAQPERQVVSVEQDTVVSTTSTGYSGLPKRLDLLEGKVKDVQFLQVDVSDKIAVDAAFSEPWPNNDKSPISIFNTAANIRFYERHASLIPLSAKVNVQGPENIIDACRKVGACVLVHTSSGSVSVHSSCFLLWPWQDEPKHFVQGVNDDDGLIPKVHKDFFSNYGYTKRQAEVVVRGANDADGLRTGYLRPGNMRVFTMVPNGFR